MRQVVVIALLALFTAGFAAEKPTPMVMPTSGADPCVKPGYQQAVDPAIAAIQAQEQALLARGDFSGAKALESQVQAILLQRMPRQAPAAGPVPVTAPLAMGGSFDPDQLVFGGGISAFGADYEQDANGTMWAVVGWLADTTVRVLNSTDHGATWNYFGGYVWGGKPVATKLDIVVGMGDSNFIHVFDLHPGSDGDLWDVRFDRSAGFTSNAVMVGADTITDFSACRDFTTPYWLYAVAHNGLQPSDSPVAHIVRSTDFGLTWAVTNTIYNMYHPHMSFGAGAWGYVASAPSPHALQGWVGAVFSNSVWSPGAIVGRSFQPDTFRVWDAVIAPAFTMPETSAITYAAYSHNYQGTTDWDVLYSWMDSTVSWHGPYYASGSGTLGEAYVDLKNYTSLGNTYMNLSYGTWNPGVTSSGPVYIRWVNAVAPDIWSDSTRISQTVSSYCGWPTTPKIVYSPNGPGSGGGVVFVDDQYPNNLYFNAPWHTGVAENRSLPPPVVAFSATPTVARGAVRLTWAGNARQVTVTDVAGRVLRTYNQPEGNSLVWDGKAPAGTYFCRVVTAQGAATRPVIIQ